MKYYKSLFLVTIIVVMLFVAGCGLTPGKSAFAGKAIGYSCEYDEECSSDEVCDTSSGQCVSAPVKVTPLSSPASLSPSGTVPYAYQVELMWGAVSGASSYNVRVVDNTDKTYNTYSLGKQYQNNCGNVDHYVCVNGVSTTSFVTKVVPGHSYSWWVHAANANVISDPTSGSFTVVPSCVDSDNGINFSVKGTVTGAGYPQGFIDSCGSKYSISERFCANDSVQTMAKNCLEFGTGYLCQDGACVRNITCTDSDNTAITFDQKDFFVKGKVISNDYPNGKEDYCNVIRGKSYLMEGKCDNNNYGIRQKNCGELYDAKGNSIYQCVDGACVDCSNPKTAVDSCVIDIPDVNLKKVILQTLNKSSGDVTVGEVKKIISLTPVSKNISNLKGMEYFIQLQTLYLDGNQISNIDSIKSLAQLNYLSIGGNKLSNVNALKNLTNLQLLYLDNNQISDITALKDLTKLIYLRLENNPIYDISALKYLISLHSLVISGTQISDISALKELKPLTGLDLSRNKISDISGLKNLVNLKYLYLWNTKLKYTGITNGICDNVGVALLNETVTVQQFLAKCT